MSAHAIGLNLTVAGKQEIAQGIFQFELIDPAGKQLPGFTAGAHISVLTPSGLVNKYSLCNNPNERNRYVIAVKRDEQGRGGSISMAEELDTGETVGVSLPENAFELTEKRKKYVFIAGGIGITPIYSMVRYLLEAGKTNFTLYYLTRNAASTPFLDAMQSSPLLEHTVIHHDEGTADSRYDLWPVLENPADKQVYCCGPRFLMEEVKDMTGHWPRGTVTFESFGTEAKNVKNNVRFTITLKSSGRMIEVDERTSILQALANSGVVVPSSCESGTCGTCKTGLIAGEADHRDMVLDESEKHNRIMICVSRAKRGNLVLDL